jgi:hypothetical protein
MSSAWGRKGLRARCAAALALTLLSIASTASLAATDDERIQAVTDFLIDRAKANYLYIFEQQIARNRTVQCYFPTVYSYVRDGDLRLLLKGRELWQNSVKEDLRNLPVKAAAKAVAGAGLRRIALDATNRYVEIQQYLSVQYQGTEYSLSVFPFPRPPQDVVDFLNGFYRVNEARDYLLELDAAVRKVDPGCGIPALTYADVKQLLDRSKAAMEGLAAWARHIEANARHIRVDTAKLELDCKKSPAPPFCGARDKLLQEWQGAAGDLAKVALQASQFADQLQQYKDDLDKATTDTARVLIAIRLLRETKALQSDEIVESLKRQILFFAEISDAKSRDEVKAVLEDYTLPPVSFGLKREKYKEHIMISALFGYGYGKVADSGGVSRDNNQGIYAPIGLEFSHGLGSGASVSVMLAPFDFGYPISLRMNGISDEMKFSDVVAPSISVSYGVARYPLSVGLAYQRGRKDPASSDVEKRMLLFFGFDMPLFTLF